MLASLAVRSLEEVAQLLSGAVGLQGGFCAHYFYVWELTEKAIKEAIKRLSNPKNPSSLLKDKAQLGKMRAYPVKTFTLQRFHRKGELRELLG